MIRPSDGDRFLSTAKAALATAFGTGWLTGAAKAATPPMQSAGAVAPTPAPAGLRGAQPKPSVPNLKFAGSRGQARNEFRVREHTSNHMNLVSFLGFEVR